MKMRPSSPPTPKKSRSVGKRPQDARDRILAAGRKVFTSSPYGAAGVRKIENTGGISYALIRYYFGSKKGLFTAVAAEAAGEYEEFIRLLIQRAAACPEPGTEFPELIDQLIDFCFGHPDGPTLIMLNIGDPRHLEGTLLGSEEMGRRFDFLRRLSTKRLPAEKDDCRISGWMFAFALIIVNLIGARTFHATSLGLTPGGIDYRQWVRAALRSIFQPVPAKTLNADRTDPEIIIPDDAQRLIGEGPPPDDEAIREGKTTKGDLTRKKILDAAQAVFTQKPYHTAGLRLIGRQGDFDFTIIHHYFPTKKALAEAVTKRIYDNFFRASTYWWLAFTDRETTSRPLYLSSAMSQYFDRLLDYCFDHPEAPAILMQNIAQPDRMESLPGFESSVSFFSDILKRLKTFLPVTSSEETIRMWQYCLATLISNCVGAPTYPARVLGRSPGETVYRKWVKEIVLHTFYPGLKRMLYAARDDRPGR